MAGQPQRLSLMEKQIIEQLKQVVAISSAEATIIASQIQLWLDQGELREPSVSIQIHDWIFAAKLRKGFIAIDLTRARYAAPRQPQWEEEEPTILVPLGEHGWVSEWEGDAA